MPKRTGDNRNKIEDVENITIIDNDDLNETATEEKPIIDKHEMTKIENLIEESAKYTKKVTRKKKPVEEKYKFLNIDEDELMNEEVEQIYSSSPDYIVNGSLRDYQIASLNWLISLHNRDLNGILADEMGLGKTLQTIAVLGHMKNVLQISDPHLIIVPKSTVRNWANEISKFCPSLKTLVIMGQKDDRKELVKETLKNKKFKYDVLITSYDIALLEKSAIKKIKWHYIVIDEAHRIKNSEARLSSYVRELNTNHRLLLTGTPLQNNLNELWALLNFLLPTVFSSNEEFIEIFDEKAILGLNTTSTNETETAAPDDNVASSSSKPKFNSEELVDKLRAIIKPFLLRRIKSEVEKSIPPKNEIYLYAELTQMQRDLYKSLLLKDISALKSCTNNKQTGIGKLLNAVMQVRKCCSHPYLFDGVESGPPYVTDSHIVNACGKMVILDKLLGRLKQGGNRALIFSQFLRTIDIIEDYLMWKGFKYFRLDGNTDLEERQQMIDAFNDPKNHSEYFVFVISTRAGGLGINLATADTVIFYDSDWNPQVDLQAMDRAHRIGQLKPVNVYRLITEHTVEERILSRASYKMNIDRCVIQRKRDDGTDDPLILSKDDAIATLNRGLDFILRANSNTVDKEQKEIDIETLIEKSKKIRQISEKDIVLTKESMELNKEKFKQNLIKLGSMEDYTVYEFEGQNYAVNKQKKIEQAPILSNRLRTNRTTYYRPQETVLEKFRFYPPRLAELIEREEYTYRRLIGYVPVMDSTLDEAAAFRKYNAEREKMRNAVELSKSEQDEKARLMKMGFQNWTKTEFNAVCQAMKLYGRLNYEQLERHVQTKTIDEIRQYLHVFWKRVDELPNGVSIVRGVEKAEEKIREKKKFNELLEKKFAHVVNPITDLQLSYSYLRANPNEHFTPDEDKILLFLYYRLRGLYLNDEIADDKGVNSTRLFQRIYREIQVLPACRFRWYFLACDANALKARWWYLAKLLQYEDRIVSRVAFNFDHDYNIAGMAMEQVNNEEDTGIYILHETKMTSDATTLVNEEYDADNTFEDVVNESMDIDYDAGETNNDDDGNVSSSSSSASSIASAELNSKKMVKKVIKPKKEKRVLDENNNRRNNQLLIKPDPIPFWVGFDSHDMDTDDSLPAI